MAYVYHERPAAMHGATLYPLNTLRSVNEGRYTLEARKYSRREEVRRERIPRLGCLWNDVVHCLPMHPSRVYQALVECGLTPGRRYWFALDIARIMKNPCAWFDFRTSPPFPVPEDEVRILTAESYRELDAVPEETKEWYRYLARHGGKLQLTYRYIPHVFVMGPIDTTGAPIVEWSESVDRQLGEPNVGE